LTEELTSSCVRSADCLSTDQLLDHLILPRQAARAGLSGRVDDPRIWRRGRHVL